MRTFSFFLPLLRLLLVSVQIITIHSSSTRGYDQHSGQFNPQGNLIQLEYAKKAIHKYGGLLFAIKATNGILFYSSLKKRNQSKLILQSFSQKVTILHDHLMIGTSGLAIDAMTIIELAKLLTQSYYEKYLVPIPIETLCQELANQLYRQTVKEGSRPLGVKLIVAGCDTSALHQGSREGNDRYRIFTIEPEGAYYSWKAIAIGEEEETVNQQLMDYFEAKSPFQSISHTQQGLDDAFPLSDIMSLIPFVRSNILDKFEREETPEENTALQSKDSNFQVYPFLFVFSLIIYFDIYLILGSYTFQYFSDKKKLLGCIASSMNDRRSSPHYDMTVK